MHRVDATGHYGNTFTDGGSGIEPTTLAAKWHNAVQEELANVIEFTGDTLSAADNTQLLTNLIPHIPGATALRAIAPVNGYRVYLQYHTTAGDGGHGVFRGVTGAAAATYTHNNGTIIVPSGGDGSAAWVREYTGAKLIEFYGKTFDDSVAAGTVMGIEELIEDSTYPLASEAGIWSAEAYAHYGISKEFTSTYAATPAGSSPTTNLFVFTNNNNADGDVVGVMSDAVARNSNDIVFAANFIARNAAGTTGSKLVGLEIDVEPAAGTTISSASAGIYLNMFSIGASLPAIQVGGLSSGTWGNGIILDKITGAGVAAASGSTGMDSLINASTGAYDDSAIILGEGNNTTGIKWATNSGRFYVDSSGNFRLVMPVSKVLAFRNSTDTTSVASIDASGNYTGATYKDSSGNQLFTSRITGWGAPTGTPTRTTFDTTTVTLSQLAERVKALIDDCTSHGFIHA